MKNTEVEYVRVKYDFRTEKGTRVSMGLRGKVIDSHQDFPYPSKTLVELGSGDSMWLPTDALETWEPCHSCEMLRINGTVTHETGCPDAWKDELRNCNECGQKFFPQERYQDCCGHSCMVSYHNFSCDCEICRSPMEDELNL